jgi:hypothetical protein
MQSIVLDRRSVQRVAEIDWSLSKLRRASMRSPCRPMDNKAYSKVGQHKCSNALLPRFSALCTFVCSGRLVHRQSAQRASQERLALRVFPSHIMSTTQQRDQHALTGMMASLLWLQIHLPKITSFDRAHVVTCRSTYRRRHASEFA